MPAAASPNDPRPRDADATRQDLLLAAQRRFVLLGYERSTTRDIADDAGVNVALISRYFGGKRGLYRAVLESSAELFEASARRRPQPQGGLVEEFLGRLDASSWPELGGHPLTLLLRGDDDDTRPLRAHALGTAVRHARASVGREDSEDPEDELRAELVLALFCGVVGLRSAGLVDRLSSASPEELRGGIEDAVAALLGTADDG